ncbi:uncharacterized protein LOC131687715 [Topomyia yanbarensis]|uniref:uncharacterized protein LOC131687715 n=1 Tax=Topomyia yanbarensis TaxID=2498891 RepID=UPI00273B126A|nr:uncharacterized protein LOC131687715 [Topomyia yanbarensis]
MSYNNYSVVQCSFDEEESYLCVLPSSWVVEKGWNKGVRDKLTALDGGDICYWPAKAAGYRLLEKAKKTTNISIDKKLLIPYRCKIKRIGFETYNDACKEQKLMEMHSDTDNTVPKKRMNTDTRAADMFVEILGKKQNATPRADLVPSLSTAAGDQTPTNKRYLAEGLTDDSFNSDLDGSVQNKHIPLKQLSLQQGILPSRKEPVSDSQEETITLRSLFERVQNLATQLDRCLLMLSQVNAKLDTIGSRNHLVEPNNEDQIEVKQNVLQPVTNLAELEAVDEMCSDDRFVESVIKSMGKVHDRRFLRDVSWTGVSKTKDKHGKPKTKIAFSKYNKFIDVFFQTVLNADELFSLEACHKFLKQCIRNSKQRLEDIKQIRTSVSRKRCRKNVRMEEQLEKRDDTSEDRPSDDELDNNASHQTEDLTDSQGMIIEFLEETVLKSEPVVE